jgi:hypothetical protein
MATTIVLVPVGDWWGITTQVGSVPILVTIRPMGSSARVAVGGSQALPIQGEEISFDRSGGWPANRSQEDYPDAKAFELPQFMLDAVSTELDVTANKLVIFEKMIDCVLYLIHERFVGNRYWGRYIKIVSVSKIENSCFGVLGETKYPAPGWIKDGIKSKSYTQVSPMLSQDADGLS